MAWIKNVLIDIAVTIMIVLAVTMNLAWARWIVLIYTPLMLILKIVVFLGSRSLGQIKRKGDGVPMWFYHALYAVNVAGSGGYAYTTTGTDARLWWMIAGGWVVIWILSFASEMRLRPADK